MRLLMIICSIGFLGSFSACGLLAAFTGQRVTPNNVSDTANQGALSYERNNCGEIIAVCCETACMNADSVSEFQDEFSSALKSIVSDRNQLRQIGSQVVFVIEIAKACNSENNLEFSIVNADGSQTNIPPVSMDPEVLESANPHPLRNELRALLKKWKTRAVQGGGEKLQIGIKICGDTSSIPSQCNSGSCTDSNSGNRSCSEECRPCSIPPSTTREYEFDWNGII